MEDKTLEEIMAELPAPHTARMQYEALFARLKKAEAETSTVVKYSIGPEENAAAIPIISELRGKLRKYDAYAVDAAAKHIKKLEATLKAMGEALESPELLERLAALEHERWAGWMLYQERAPEERRKDWPRKVGLKYSGLTEHEKESDRIEARKSLALIREALAKSKKKKE